MLLATSSIAPGDRTASGRNGKIEGGGVGTAREEVRMNSGNLSNRLKALDGGDI